MGTFREDLREGETFGENLFSAVSDVKSFED